MVKRIMTGALVLWLSAILVCLSVLMMSPSISLLLAVLAGIPAAVSVLFRAGRLRIVGMLLLILSLAAVYNHYPPYKEHMDRYLQHAEPHRVDEKEDAGLILKKACLKATMSAIEMEIGRFEQRLKAAKEGPGDPRNIPDFEKRIKELDAEYGKYEKMSPAHYTVPEKKIVKVKVTRAYRKGSILELVDITRSGPFYHVAGIKGDDYELLKPDKTYQMTIYMIYSRDYFAFITNYYVYVKNFNEIGGY